jgi:cell division septum initiation protein DivIVA
MTRRIDVPPPPRNAGRPPSSGDPGRQRTPRPNLTGDLDSMLGTGPMFRPAVRGYDRLQVDNYVTWVETELQSARRQVEELTTRYGSALAEMEISRRLLAQSPTGREMTRISERIGQMLRLAADEAADVSAAGAREGDRLVSEARTEADAILRKAREVKEAAVAASDRMRQDSRLMRAEAMAVLDRARREAAELLRAAGLERRRLDQQTEQARRVLRGVTAQIGAAIGALAGDLQRDFGAAGEEPRLPHRFEDNSVQPVAVPDGSAAELAERSSEPAGA